MLDRFGIEDLVGDVPDFALWHQLVRGEVAELERLRRLHSLQVVEQLRARADPWATSGDWTLDDAGELLFVGEPAWSGIDWGRVESDDHVDRRRYDWSVSDDR